MGDPSRARVTGPLERYAPGFVAELARLGYTPNSASGQMFVMAHLVRWLAGEGLDAAGLTPQVAERFLAARRTAGYTLYLSPKALVPLLGYLRRLGAVPEPAPVPATPVEALLGRYQRYLVTERGLVPATARGYADFVRPFLDGREKAAGLDLARLTAGDVTAFVLATCPGKPKGSAKLTVTALRSLLGYLHVEGLISEPLGQMVPAVASWRLAGLPRALEPGQVAALLAWIAAGILSSSGFLPVACPSSPRCQRSPGLQGGASARALPESSRCLRALGWLAAPMPLPGCGIR